MSTFPSGSEVYLDPLLWLIQGRPSPYDRDFTFAFGQPGQAYTIDDMEAVNPTLVAQPWNSSIGPTATQEGHTFVDLPYGRQLAPLGLSGEKAAIYFGLQLWANVANITIRPVPDPTAADFKFLTVNEGGMANYFGGEKGVLGFSTLPVDISADYGAPPLGSAYDPGYTVFNNEGYGWTSAGLVPGGYGWVTLVHEIGHLFGLDHPFQEGGINEPAFPGATGTYKIGDHGLNQGVFTTMTYNDGWKDQPSKGIDSGFQIGPGAFDIAALQKLYGANKSFQGGDNIYTLPTANEPGTGWYTVWDTGGADAIIAPGGASATTIDLREAPLVGPNAGGYVSWVSGVAGGYTIANGVAVERAVGGSGNDKLIGNALSNVIEGRAGADTMQGGAGPDRFVFTSALDSGISAKADTIEDFKPGEGDKLDFRVFDRDPLASGIQDLDFVFRSGPSAAFKAGDGVIGELIFSKEVLSGDTNDDAKADFQIKLPGIVALRPEDLLLHTGDRSPSGDWIWV